MDPIIQDNLLSSSDYELIINELKKEPNLYQLSPMQVAQKHVSVEQNPVKMDSSYPLLNPPPLEVHQNYRMAEEPMQEVETVQGPPTNPEVPIPSFSPTSTIPCRDDYPGPLEFEIFLDASTSDRRSWVFSHKLNKVFIDMNKSLLMKFRVNQYMSGLFVRALPVYATADHVSIPVQRCAYHELQFDSQRHAHIKKPGVCCCEDYMWVRHVVQSTHSQVQYHYDSESDRHSVVVPLEQPPAGTDFSTVEYHFTCKTSCAHGMQRRPINVIFTLETEQFEVIGRQLIEVKICSCPKRDKDKEEDDQKTNGTKSTANRKRPMTNAEKEDARKKIKDENSSPQQKENPSEDQTLLSKLVDMISSQNAQLVELHGEMQQQREEMQQQREEMQQQREEMQQLRVELQQHRAKESETSKRLEDKLDTISYVLRQSYMYAQK